MSRLLINDLAFTMIKQNIACQILSGYQIFIIAFFFFSLSAEMMFLFDVILRRGSSSDYCYRTVELTGNFSCFFWRHGTSSVCVCVGSPVSCPQPQCSGFKHMRQTTRSPDTSNITQGLKPAMFQPNSFTVLQ